MNNLESIENNQVHLCNSCCHNYPDCDCIDIIFGDGCGYDNICCCNHYIPLVERDIVRGGYTWN